MLLETAEVLWTARYDYDAGWVLKPHAHDFFQAVYLVAGTGTLTLGGSQHPLRPAHIFVAPPGVKHGLRASIRVRTLDMKFRVGNRKLAAALSVMGPLYCAADASIRILFERVWQEADQNEPLCREMCAVHLLELLLRLRRAGERRGGALLSGAEEDVPRGDALTSAVAGWVRDHLAEPLTVRRLAAQLNCSERTLRQHFHDVLGVSPVRYIMHPRMERAKRLIHESDRALKEVAAMVGFRSIHHFTRVFHQITGLSPGAFRERYVRGVRRDLSLNPAFRNDHRTVDHGSGRRRPVADLCKSASDSAKYQEI